MGPLRYTEDQTLPPDADAARAADATRAANAARAAVAARVAVATFSADAATFATFAVRAANDATFAVHRDADRGANLLPHLAIPLPADFQSAIDEWSAGRIDLLTLGGPWRFWGDWYARAMAGDHLPWDLQEQIALKIPDEIWEAGPEAVAAEIERIEAAFELRSRIADFEADQATVEEKRLGIGGNNPPKEIDDPETAAQVIVLWESIAGLKEEVAAVEPDAERVATLIERLGTALKAVIAWCGRKGDLMVDTTIKWGIPAVGGGYFLVNRAKAEAVLKAAQQWLPFLAP
jgi:hypothetical protein